MSNDTSQLPPRVQRGKTSKRKGQKFEYTCQNYFRRWWPKCFRVSGKGSDVMGTPFYIEAKNYSKMYDGELEKIWNSAHEKSGPLVVIVFYKDRSKSKRGPGGKSYIRLVLHRDHLSKFEGQAKIWEPRNDEHRVIGSMNHLKEISDDYALYLFDLIYKRI